MIYLLILVISHSHVELPAGTFLVFDDEHRATNAFVFLRAAAIHDLCYLPTERFFLAAQGVSMANLECM